MSPPVHDLLGVGIGPFNLSLAALLDPVGELDAVFFDQAEAFAWHPGLLLEGATTQVPFLADLVTLADPTSRHSFLEYLRAHDRLYRFYLRERFHLPRREYDHYCRWVAGRLPGCRFGTRSMGSVAGGAGAVRGRADRGGQRAASRRRARNLVIASAPPRPSPAPWPRPGQGLFHRPSSWHRERLRQAAAVTVVGSGQSGAEVFLELLREQPGCGYRLDWLTRSAGFFPMEYSRLGLEHFTPDYTRYFHGLPGPTRDRLLPTQDLLYKGIDVETIAEIHELLYERTVAGAEAPVRLLAHAEVRSLEPAGGRWKLTGHQWEQGRDFTVEADCVVLATGYRDGPPACLTGWPAWSTGTGTAATRSASTTGWPPTRGSPAGCTCRTASSTPTGWAPPTSAWAPTGPPPSSTR